jgi:hypothetical protein
MAKPYQYPSSNQSFSQTVTSVASSNGLKNANSITPGQTITLPDGSSVTAQKGDTLSGIVDKWKTNAATQAQPTPVTQAVAAAPAGTSNPDFVEHDTPPRVDVNNLLDEKPKPISVDTPTGSNKIPPIRSNPLSAFSSSTYNISLYMINPDTFNQYANGGHKVPKDWKLICRSGGINNSGAENGRAEGFELDYYIDDLRIVSAISSKETYSACNSFDFSFHVYEPYGFSFPTRLVTAATKVQAASKIQRNISGSITALQTQYLLVIRFYGYDKNGKLVTSNDYPMAEKNTSDPTAVFERSFPIQISGFDFKLDPKMVVYNVKAKLISEQLGLGKTKLEIPDALTVKGETVRDVLSGSDNDNKNSNATGLMQQLNEHQQKLFDNEKIEVKDKFSIRFEGDENSPIGRAVLVDVDNDPIEKSPNTSVTSADGVNAKTSAQPAVISRRTRPISLNKGDSILQAIDQIITQSSYVTSALKIKTKEEYTQTQESDEDYVKNTPVTIGWYNVVPDVKLLAFDNKRNVFATDVTYIIKRYEVPYIRGLQLGKRTPYYGPVKRYKHWYMSNDLDKKNSQHQKEILNYEVTYNLLYFNLAGYGTDAPNDVTDDSAPVANLSGGSNPQGKAPGHFDKAVGPLKTFLYSPGDQLKAKIVILGDPDYLMTSTTKGYEEAITKWFGTDQSINPNSGQVFIEIDFRDAEDYSPSTGKKADGLLNPSQDGNILFWKYPDSIKKDVQGTIYMVWQVISTFEKGIFKQELKVCIPPFVSDQAKSKSENDREVDSLLSRYPAPTPSEFNTVDTATNNTNESPITVADNSFTGGGLKLDASSLGPWRTTIAPEKPESAFGVANDDQTYSINSTNANDIGMREA